MVSALAKSRRTLQTAILVDDSTRPNLTARVAVQQNFVESSNLIADEEIVYPTNI